MRNKIRFWQGSVKKTIPTDKKEVFISRDLGGKEQGMVFFYIFVF